ncbi:MAG: pectinesterase family protein [Bacteroidales bacterium]|nr:pectinesterase family protein [Bacteroidales bacterium]
MRTALLTLFLSISSLFVRSVVTAPSAVPATVPGSVELLHIKAYEGCRIQNSPLLDYANGEDGYILFDVRPTATGNYTFTANLATGTGSNRYCSLGPIDVTGNFIDGVDEKIVLAGTNSSNWTENANDYSWTYNLVQDSIYTFKLGYRKNGEAYGINVYSIAVTSDAVAAYTVTYYDANGNVFMSQPYPEGGLILLPSGTPTAPSGMYFSHWETTLGVQLTDGSAAATMDVHPVWAKAEWSISSATTASLPVNYIRTHYNCTAKGDQLIDSSRDGSYILFDGKVDSDGYYLFTASIGTKMDQIACALGYVDNANQYVDADTLAIQNNNSWSNGKPYQWLFYLQTDTVYQFKMSCLAGGSYALNVYDLQANIFVPNTGLKTAFIDGRQLIPDHRTQLASYATSASSPNIEVIPHSMLATVSYQAKHNDRWLEWDANNCVHLTDVPVGDTVIVNAAITDGPLTENHWIHLIVNENKQTDVRGGTQNDGLWSDGWSNYVYTLNPSEMAETFVSTSWLRSDDKIIYGFHTKQASIRWSIPPLHEIQGLSVIGYTLDNQDATFSILDSSGTQTIQTATMPASSTIDQPTECYLTLDGHRAGSPFILRTTGAASNVYFRLHYSDRLDLTAPVLSESNIKDNEILTSPNGTLRLRFDEGIRFTSEASIRLNDQRVEARIHDLVFLSFDFWALDYNSSNQFVIKANSLMDEAGNVYPNDIELTLNIGNRPPLSKRLFDFVVGIDGTIDQAIAAANAASGDHRFLIFVPKGMYELSGNEADHMTSLTRSNVSIVGEHMDSSIVFNTPESYGISSTATLHIKYASKTYIQDITLQNTKGEADQGQQVALFDRGSQNTLKNVKLFSYQDTYVSGHRAYFENCNIYGATDFICGGGDVFFQSCLIYNRTDGNVITAPATDVAHSWGYVFNDCTIDGGTFTLGRPWQNEPRAYFLNTRMRRQPSGTGWSGMSELDTHFYEYNSMDWSGNVLDLSKRGNSPTSKNHYTPILTDTQAAQFTLYNVLRGNDGWVPSLYTKQATPPDVSIIGNLASWTDKDDVLCTFIFKDGQYLTHTTSNSLILTEPGTYSFRCANEMGGLGSETVHSFQVTDMNPPTLDYSDVPDTQVLRFDLNGRPMKANKEGGLFIRGRSIILQK